MAPLVTPARSTTSCTATRSKPLAANNRVRLELIRDFIEQGGEKIQRIEIEASGAIEREGDAHTFVVSGTGEQGLFLRAGPSTQEATVATLPEGTRVEALGEEQNDGTRTWHKVRTPQGEGWVAADFIIPEP